MVTKDTISNNTTEALKTVISNISNNSLNSKELTDSSNKITEKFNKLLDGYDIDINELLANSLMPCNGYSDFILFEKIYFISHCKHHLTTIKGNINVCYIPDKSIISLGRVIELCNALSHKLQIQEVLTIEISKALFQHLQPKALAVIISGQHDCISSLKNNQQNFKLKTMDFLGEFKNIELQKKLFSLL